MAMQKNIYRNEFDKKVSLNFFRYYMLRNSFFMYFFTVFGLLALFMLINGAFKNEEKTSTYFLMWTVAIMGIVFVPMYTFFNIRMSARRDYKRRNGTIEVVEISKEKITRMETTKGGKMVINWVNITRVVEVNEAFYIFLGTDEAFTVAKKGLEEGSIELTRNLMKTYLKPDNKGRVPLKIKDKEYLKAEKEAKKLAKGKK